MSEDPRTDPPPQEDPTHDVPIYPEHDPPAETEQPVRAASKPGGPSERERHREGQSGDGPKEGDEDVDEDDLDPQAPHSPPDVKKRKIVFDENAVTG